MQSAYKNEKLKKKALASYDKILSEWPVEYDERYIETNHGKTYILISGHQDGIPLILLHGGGGNSTMWKYNIADLSKYFRVYSVDIIGEAGKSSEKRPSFKTEIHSDWLKEVIDALSLDKPTICGASLGGMLALNFGLKYPNMVSALILLAPPTLLKINVGFMIRAICAFLLPITYFSKKFLGYMSSAGENFDNNDTESFITQVQSYKPISEPITVISDSDLSKLTVKSLLLLGENEVLFDSKLVVQRVEKVNPSIQIEVMPNAKHTVSLDCPELFCKSVVKFCLAEAD